MKVSIGSRQETEKYDVGVQIAWPKGQTIQVFKQKRKWFKIRFIRYA